MDRKERFCIIGLICLAVGRAASAEPISDMIVFGDSLSDTGNVYATATLKIEDNTGVLYNGKANYPGPTPPALSGNGLVNLGLKSNYNYTQGRFTDGADTTPKTAILGVWVEQLAPRLNVAAPKPSTGGGNNYAYGGAETKAGQTTIPSTTSLGSTTVTSSATVDNIGKQVDTFATAKGGKADSKALYVIWGGGNDMINTTEAVLAGTQNANAIGAAEKTAVTNLKSYIQSLYDIGARCVLWPNLPPMALLPRFSGKDAATLGKLSDAANAFKTDEAAAINDLQMNNAGLTVTEVDVLGLFSDVFKNPGAAKYGFDNITDSAWSSPNANPDKYVFWDATHPTTRTDQLIAGAAYDALVASGCIPEPATAMLTLAMAAVALRRRVGRHQS